MCTKSIRRCAQLVTHFFVHNLCSVVLDFEHISCIMIIRRAQKVHELIGRIWKWRFMFLIPMSPLRIVKDTLIWMIPCLKNWMKCLLLMVCPTLLPFPHEKTMEDCPEATLEVAYDSSDDITFSLVYILFNKTYRGVTDKAVAESMIKVSAKYMDAE